MVVFGTGMKNAIGQRGQEAIKLFGMKSYPKILSWDYLIIWQCEIKKGDLDKLAQKLTCFLN